jgi:hypothetical protein
MMIAARTDQRFFTPFWPDHPTAGGLIGYADAQLPRIKRPRMFEALSDRPVIVAEMESLLRAAPPERRDAEGLVDGLAAAGADAASRRALLAELAPRVDRLNIKDLRVALLLAGEWPDDIDDRLADRLLDLADELPLSETRFWDAMSRFARARGREELTRQLLRYMMAADMLEYRASYLGGPWIDRIERYVSLLPADRRAEAMRYLLTRRAPTPLDRLADALDADRIDRLVAIMDEDARKQLADRLRRRLAGVEGVQNVRAATARLMARLDQVEEFTDLVRTLLAAQAQYDATEALFDVRRLVPSADEVERPERWAMMVADQVEADRAAGKLSDRSAVALWCLLGDRCHQLGREAAAEGLADRAGEIADGVGFDRLWVADLARRIGRAEQAVNIERQLLSDRLLPAARLPDLLEAVESSQGQKVADRLAYEASSWTHRPSVLRRAIRHARREGLSSRADPLGPLLQAVTPGR